MIKIEVSPRMIKTLRKLGEEYFVQAEQKLLLIGADFGNPHAHSGLGLRKIGRNSYEARIGLQWRIVLIHEKDRLLAFDVLNHDGVRQWLKNSR
jgi:mRNA-degrading endonuclease RelE of RelBE toxin-antitoxin system